MPNSIKQNPLIDAYILLAWETLRGENDKGERYSSVHTTFTPFNQLFRQLFDGIDPVAYTKMLEAKGDLKIGLARRGAMIRPSEQFLRPAPSEHKETIAMMRRLLEDAVKEQKKRREEAQARKLVKPACGTCSPVQKAWAAGDTKAALKKFHAF